ncbi:MAG: alpha/beta hydrolase [Acidobacteria bacterium]|nr:alpha/beta hydrolase [Acidobacteriota bacterium]MCA1639006.1 alpha/beta hydrolase [Acidobacteriota bacterium]
MKKITLSVLLMCLFSIAAFGQTNRNTGNSQSRYKNLQPCEIKGAADSVLCGTHTVFENHQTKQGRRINLNVIVIPALNKDSVKPPVFFFDGGPGIAATNAASFFAQKDNSYRQNHDVVLVDIRGTGGSNPLHCRSLQEKKDLQEQFAEMYPAKAVKDCYSELSQKADLLQYNTTNVVRDIEQVKQELGYKKIHLFGLSYGTRVAQEYMRQFPASVESAVFHSPTSTNSKAPLFHARFAQDTLDKLFDDCLNDSPCKTSFPLLKKEFNELMQKGKKRPFNIVHTMSDGSKKNLFISWNAFQTKIRSMMYQPRTLKKIPSIIHQAYQGNWKPFVSLYSEKGGYNDFLAQGFYLSVTCSEDVPFITNREAKRLTKNTFMGMYRIEQQQTACANWVRGNIPNDYLQPVRSDIPVLILSGEYDPVTPVSMAKEIAGYLPNSQLVVIPQMSHIFDGLSNEDCFDRIALDFIEYSGKSKLDTTCVKSMQPPPYEKETKL